MYNARCISRSNQESIQDVKHRYTNKENSYGSDYTEFPSFFLLYSEP